MKVRRLKVGLDLDGVVCDFNSKMVEALNERGYGCDLEDITDYSYYRCIKGLSKLDANEIFNEVTSGKSFWKSLEPTEELDAAKELCERYHVYVVSSRRERTLDSPLAWDTLEQTRWWLKSYGLEVAGVVMVKGHSKQNACSSLGLVAHVDDNPYTFKRLELSPFPCFPFLFDAPYNQEVETSHRVYSLDEYMDKIENLDL